MRAPTKAAEDTLSERNADVANTIRAQEDFFAHLNQEASVDDLSPCHQTQKGAMGTVNNVMRSQDPIDVGTRKGVLKEIMETLGNCMGVASGESAQCSQSRPSRSRARESSLGRTDK